MKRVHATGLFGGSDNKRKTWCGRFVADDQLPIIGTRRTVTCRACAQSKQAHGHAQRWGYSYRRRWASLLGRAS